MFIPTEKDALIFGRLYMINNGFKLNEITENCVTHLNYFAFVIKNYDKTKFYVLIVKYSNLNINTNCDVTDIALKMIQNSPNNHFDFIGLMYRSIESFFYFTINHIQRQRERMSVKFTTLPFEIEQKIINCL